MRHIYTCALILAISLIIVSTDAQALCVSSSYANLRSGPATSYEKTWEVFKYMPLKQLKKQGKWYRVRDLEGDIHWVYAPLVTKAYKCAAVKDEKANIRSGPGTKYAHTPESPARMYYTYKVLRIKGKWVKVIDEYGAKGWIYKPLLWIQ